MKLPRTKADGPEKKIQDSLLLMLKGKDWYVKSTHGNIYQFGFPDLYACHRMYGTRWIEVKNPEAYSFTNAQLETFPAFASKSVGIWILVSDSDYEYQKLFGPPNWHLFLGKSRVY